jgi:hypothetical protein
MTISARDTIAVEALDGNKSVGTRAYFQGRLKNRLHNLVIRKFEEAEIEHGLTRAELARRIGKRPEVLTRLLGAPGNWTLDTVSDLLLGIAGYELDATATKIADRAKRNSNYGALSDQTKFSGIGLNQKSDSTNINFQLGLEHAGFQNTPKQSNSLYAN